MFGKDKRSKEGATAEAVVAEVKRVGGVTYNPDGSSNAQYDLTLHVRYPDGSTGEAKYRAGGWFKGIHALFTEGDIVPVRYDPADRAKVEVDLAAMEAAQKTRSAAAEQARIALAEDQLARKSAPTGSQPLRGVAETRRILDEFKREQGASAGSDASVSPAPLTAAEAPSARADPLERLKALADLRDRGVLTDQEFVVEKAKILDGGLN